MLRRIASNSSRCSASISSSRATASAASSRRARQGPSDRARSVMQMGGRSALLERRGGHRFDPLRRCASRPRRSRKPRAYRRRAPSGQRDDHPGPSRAALRAATAHEQRRPAARCSAAPRPPGGALVDLPKRVGVEAVPDAADSQDQFRIGVVAFDLAGAGGARERQPCAARRRYRAPTPDRAVARGYKPASDAARKNAAARTRATPISRRSPSTNTS